eukprot:TRINITY_DN17282_c0_g1_i1.p2 TRINITY_DN17282_c0_g1~~TRINITY_DN17282_c0_g1_i1.p2  ORF type:complete len:266 (-),score=15.05 TRINITY_DN17282_c0_g1_i1:41-838(-)
MSAKPKAKLQLYECVHFSKIWEDAGTSSKPYDGAFFRPNPPGQFHSLGDVVVGKLPEEMVQTWWHRKGIVKPDMPAIVVRDPSRGLAHSKLYRILNTVGILKEADGHDSGDDEDKEGVSLLAKPVDFEKIWHDTGKGAHCGNMSIWRPVPPPNYVTLGHVCTVSTKGSKDYLEKPPLDVVRCVHESQVLPALLLEHRGQRDCMWRNTTRRGEDGSVSCWMPEPCATYPNGQVGICPGTFVAKRGKEPPIQSFSNMDERVFVLTGE